MLLRCGLRRSSVAASGRQLRHLAERQRRRWAVSLAMCAIPMRTRADPEPLGVTDNGPYKFRKVSCDCEARCEVKPYVAVGGIYYNTCKVVDAHMYM